jgi:hypothetical protein
MIGRDKSVGPEGIPSAILKTGGEAMIPYLARLLDIIINNGTIPRNWKKATVVPIHKGGDRSVVKNYRPVSLISVVSKQVEHTIAGYIQVWENRDWLYEGSSNTMDWVRPGVGVAMEVSSTASFSATSG